jgi:hypothetical protein
MPATDRLFRPGTPAVDAIVAINCLWCRRSPLFVESLPALSPRLYFRLSPALLPVEISHSHCAHCFVQVVVSVGTLYYCTVLWEYLFKRTVRSVSCFPCGSHKFNVTSLYRRDSHTPLLQSDYLFSYSLSLILWSLKRTSCSSL